MSIPTGTENPRPFLPAKNFELSKSFYDALGFTKTLDGDDVAIYQIGTGGFLLQKFYVKDCAENFMMQLMVDDLDAWWAHVQSLDLKTKFGISMLRAPALQPWGLRVGYMSDPSGVLWHVAQRRPDTPQD